MSVFKLTCEQCVAVSVSVSVTMSEKAGGKVCVCVSLFLREPFWKSACVFTYVLFGDLVFQPCFKTCVIVFCFVFGEYFLIGDCCVFP